MEQFLGLDNKTLGAMLLVASFAIFEVGVIDYGAVSFTTDPNVPAVVRDSVSQVVRLAIITHTLEFLIIAVVIILALKIRQISKMLNGDSNVPPP